MSEETREVRLKRLKMRSSRRGTKEMDLILMRFAETRLPDLGAEELDRYEALLEESDTELYTWISGQIAPPEAHAPMVERIASEMPQRS
ncbi:hypothetical protein OCH239_21220 [Roseivivax halodurans JCM 10272]|uniref:FAD assembly factor SdhE n=1 Tax=Roseivivax halodurans JCM 10272 TaxID=1449350 RepID=X7EIB0_9RHOB|nr:succinate dehydrogenase assembly factor 2 [Roseivivax halodurans]ETX14873.1 hypothetical protein OCH239_21220 [Roseivivax halodurans JCM 10272]